MNVEYVPANSGKAEAHRICIMGEPGTGKTRLAATFPDPFFLDIERGAATARPEGVNRLIIPTDRNTLKVVRQVLEAMAKSPVEDGRIIYQTPSGEKVKIGTVILDSVDAIQQPVNMYGILHGRSKMERSDWDTLLNLMTPLVLDWHALPVHLVAIAHTKRVDGENGKPGTMDFSVQGALRSQMPRWFSLILHLVAGPDGKRFLVSQPTIAKGYRYVAKDRHNLLKVLGRPKSPGIIDVPADEDGYPTSQVAEAICALCA